MKHLCGFSIKYNMASKSNLTCKNSGFTQYAQDAVTLSHSSQSYLGAMPEIFFQLDYLNKNVNLGVPSTVEKSLLLCWYGCIWIYKSVFYESKLNQQRWNSDTNVHLYLRKTLLLMVLIQLYYMVMEALTLASPQISVRSHFFWQPKLGVCRDWWYHILNTELNPGQLLSHIASDSSKVFDAQEQFRRS